MSDFYVAVKKPKARDRDFVERLMVDCLEGMVARAGLDPDAGTYSVWDGKRGKIKGTWDPDE
ncbi:MAG TPA: hypothetical protein VF867_20055 [Arthrobacter sp.]